MFVLWLCLAAKDKYAVDALSEEVEECSAEEEEGQGQGQGHDGLGLDQAVGGAPMNWHHGHLQSVL